VAGRATLRVAIVDDDVWVRAGRAAALRASEGVDLVFDGDHDLAGRRTSWDDVDLLLVDAHDPDAIFDHYVGVRVVQEVRRDHGPDRIRIVVLTGHGGNDLLRIRMAEAGADELYAHRQVRTVDELLAVVFGTTELSATVDADARQRTGLPRSARVNEAIEWAGAHLDAASLDPSTPQKNLNVSRRRIITARRRIAGAVGLTKPPVATQDHPLPTWHEVASLVDRARGAERDGSDPPT
jgi:DNA-binding NarL/FixJ family response regulator